MAQMYKNLTGRWLGRYDQPAQQPSVPFEADLVEEAGSLTGETQEPNTFRRELGPTLTAILSGGRTGQTVSFIKDYQGFAQHGPVYLGEANAALTRIAGHWSFPGLPGLTGRFVMMRKPLAAAKVTKAREVKLPEGVG
jgi:hypothetical protein